MINVAVLNNYREQLQALVRKWGENTDVALSPLLPLPGVVNDQTAAMFRPEEDWERDFRSTCRRLEQLIADAGVREGQTMADDLAANCAGRSPPASKRIERVVAAGAGRRHRGRLRNRLNKVLAEYGKRRSDPADLVREVTLFAERGDISEELVRLKKPSRPV